MELIAAEDFSCSLAKGERVSIHLSAKEFVYAPAVAGADAGYAYVCVDGAPAGKIKVVFAETVEQNKIENKSFWDKLFGEKP